MTTYDVFQQTFALSLAANALQDTKATLADLQAAIEGLVPLYIAVESGKGLKGWEVVWGPTVWKHPLKPDETDADTGPDNTWYIAHKSGVQFPDGTYDTYIVAIAGTASTFDWVQEDFAVNNVVDFKQFSSNFTSPPTPASSVNDNLNSYISYGTAGAIYTLLNTFAPQSAKSPGNTIVQFLSTVPNTSRVIFTGHSLGGALSPTLALTLQVSKGLQNVLTYPTAGPSPGNKNFASLFASLNSIKKPGGNPLPWQGWNTNLFNTRDVVPQAWSTDPVANPKQNLYNIVGIYGVLNSALRIFIQFLVYIGIGRADDSQVQYTPLQGFSFTQPPPPTPSTLPQFIATVRDQHVNQYEIQLNVFPPKASLVDLYQKHGLQSKTYEEYIVTLPFFELYKVVLRQQKEAELHAAETKKTLW
ncbi:alpha/beta-hydrolase [Sistotremastrum niveocremeum HHB9708]|uniref:Alpha/beta-hydrolase n=1 Tax=Sistotremastrum niveocremeum HHB9708 TaxID=1314777 RepID=A0A164PCF3_9AGAM|nr:alpha/beta-hydrolase [Sistotremastrum niveocremeum HHB9708]